MVATWHQDSNSQLRNVAPAQYKFLNNTICLTKFELEEVENKQRLIYFPFAGGNGNSILPVIDCLKNIREVFTVDAPGHAFTQGNPCHDINQLCQIYLENFSEILLVNNIILFGHSLGAYIACTLASLLVNKNIQPILILSAASPPHLRNQHKKLSIMPTDELIPLLISLGGLPSSYSATPELFSLFELTLRADFEMYETFEFPNNIHHLRTLIIGSYDDKLCLPQNLFSWEKYFSNITIDFVSGNHLFLKASAKQISQILERFI